MDRYPHSDRDDCASPRAALCKVWSARFLRNLKVRETLQFLVNDGQQGVQSLAVSTAPTL